MPRAIRTQQTYGGPGSQNGKVGHPSHVPTPKMKLAVANYAAVGYGHQSIADCIGISLPTLYKHYRWELDFAKMEMLGKARTKLALALDKGQPWAIKYVMETQGRDMGWSPRVEHTGADGAPLFNLAGLSDHELVDLRALVSKTTVLN